MLIPKVVNRIKQYLYFLEEQKYRSIGSLDLEMFETQEVHRVPPTGGEWKHVTLPLAYGKEWTYYWFRGSFTMPDVPSGTDVYLRLAPNADSLVFVDGKPVGAVNPFHDTLRVTDAGKAGSRHTLHFESYAGHKYAGMHPLMKPAVILTLGAHIDDYPNVFRLAEITVKNPAVYSLYYDARTLFETAEQLDDDSLRKNTILRELYDALRPIRFTSHDSELETMAKAAAGALEKTLAARNGDTTPEVYLVGHAHIDHAWLWPIAETERKAARTFANMAHYAEEFPEFVFIQSQPVQLDIVKREYPAIFESVRAAYKRGQWEPNGGMWVEADCNITGGESLVRQFLVGKQATREMLGYEGDTLWLPDVFGYAACLPQILHGCEIEYFITSKINWNDTTRFPYDTFIWRGIDGTGIKTHYITSRRDGYNGKVRPQDLVDAWHNVQHKEVQNAVIKPIGEGDGGGGTMRADLEAARRLADLEGAPKTKWVKISESLKHVFASSARMPEWRGELYLELHRGTYTTQSRTKRFNRKLELELRECEFLYSLVQYLPSASGAPRPAYPREELLADWKKVLTNQFHDIIPGSSITRVYQDAERWYREVEESLSSLIAKAAAFLTGPTSVWAGDAVTVVNSMSWNRTAHVTLPWHERFGKPARVSGGGSSSAIQVGKAVDGSPRAVAYLEAPAMGTLRCSVESAGAAEASPFKRDGNRIETPFYSVELDEAGRIAHLFDKSAQREVVAPGRVLNQFQTGDDMPILWDAWDIDADWVLSIVDEKRSKGVEVVSDGPLFIQLHAAFEIGDRSHIEQDMIFYAHDRRIDFSIKVDWHESHRVLKVAFPVSVTTNEVRCEVQYGHVVRNTHSNLPQDRAKFEMCSHKWMCVEEAGYGVAVLNDCKYGCDVDGSTMRLTLLRSPKAPDPEADMGTHLIAYSLLPFAGSFDGSGVVRAAYDLNKPMTALPGAAGAAGQPSPASGSAGFSLFHLDNPNVVIESVKAVEPVGDRGRKDDDATVVRLYETAGGRQRARLSTGPRIRDVRETNMLERNPRPQTHEASYMEIELRPFEIKTLLVTFDR